MDDAMRLKRPASRRPRLSDAETEARMLEAGAAFVTAQGLSLSLEHLSMEELIHAAGVSRTSSYRRWPTKDLFTADLLLRLAEAAELSGGIPGLEEAFAQLPHAAFAHVDTPQGRRTALVETLRVLVQTDFVAMLDSSDWRTYVSLRAAHVGLPDGALRARVAEALGVTERRFTRVRAAAFETLAVSTGHRLPPADPRGWSGLALAVGAVTTGLLIRGWSDPADLMTPVETRAYGSDVVSTWPTATLVTAGVYLDAVETDPDVVWDEARIAALRASAGDLAGAVSSAAEGLRHREGLG